MMKGENDQSGTADMVESLMLLSKAGQTGAGAARRRVFTCKTCKKEFASFQALGGHRASHKKLPAGVDSQEQDASAAKKAKATASHECPICGLEFPMGQALGGHMRRHRNALAGGNDAPAAVKTRWLLPEPVTMKKSRSNGKMVVSSLDLDLSLKPLVNLDLALGLGGVVC